MEAYVARHGAALRLWKLAAALRAAALRFDAWIAACRQAAADHDALRMMSEHELRDIGIDPASVHGEVANRFARDRSV
jgi:uncharacterized protein YjiS (DUF1127 family)